MWKALTIFGSGLIFGALASLITGLDIRVTQSITILFMMGIAVIMSEKEVTK